MGTENQGCIYPGKGKHHTFPPIRKEKLRGQEERGSREQASFSAPGTVAPNSVFLSLSLAGNLPDPEADGLEGHSGVLPSPPRTSACSANEASRARTRPSRKGFASISHLPAVRFLAGCA